MTFAAEQQTILLFVKPFGRTVSWGLEIRTFIFFSHSACFPYRDWQALKVNELLRGLRWTGGRTAAILSSFFIFFGIFSVL